MHVSSFKEHLHSLEKSSVFQTIRFCRLGQVLIVHNIILMLLGILSPHDAVSVLNLLTKTIHHCRHPEVYTSIACFRGWYKYFNPALQIKKLYNES